MENMDYVVIKNYRAEFLDPIILKQGEKILIGDEIDLEYGPNWAFCKKIDGSNSGWVPKQIIQYEGDYGIIIEDYTAKELTIDEGTIVEGIKELNGWLWLKNKNTNEIGWVPMENLKKLY